MLNLNEYNESLYKALDKKNRKKNMVENYGQFLMHAKKTSGVTNLPDKTWLTDEIRGAVSEAYKVLNKKSMQVNGSNDPSVIYDACRGEISVLAKLIRKANAGGLDSSYITQLNNYRNELESRAEEARSAMSRENQGSKVARHSEEASEALEHGEKWRKHKYVRIENGRYIYPEDLKKELGNSGWMNGNNKNVQKKLSTLNEKQAIADRVASLNGNTPAAKANANNMFGVTDAKRDLANTMKSQNMMREVVNAEKKAKQDAAAKARADQNARAYDNNKAASDAQRLALQSTGPVAQKKIDEAKTANYLNNKKAAEAQAVANQNNSTIGKKKMVSGLKSNYENNKAAAEAMAEREANKNKPDPVADAKAVYEYKKKKSADEYNDAVNKLREESANKANEAKQKAQADYDSQVAEMNREIEERKKKAQNTGAKVSKTVQKVGKAVYDSIFHSSFSISDEEMEAFLAHKAN